jgi:hypothetical protein
MEYRVFLEKAKEYHNQVDNEDTTTYLEVSKWRELWNLAS